MKTKIFSTIFFQVTSLLFLFSFSSLIANSNSQMTDDGKNLFEKSESPVFMGDRPSVSAPSIKEFRSVRNPGKFDRAMADRLEAGIQKLANEKFNLLALNSDYEIKMILSRDQLRNMIRLAVPFLSSDMMPESVTVKFSTPEETDQMVPDIEINFEAARSLEFSDLAPETPAFAPVENEVDPPAFMDLASLEELAPVTPSVAPLEEEEAPAMLESADFSELAPVTPASAEVEEEEASMNNIFSAEELKSLAPETPSEATIEEAPAPAPEFMFPDPEIRALAPQTPAEASMDDSPDSI